MIKEIWLNDTDKIVFKESQKIVINNILNDDLSINESNFYREFGFYGGIRAGKSFLYQLIVFLLANKYPKLRVLYVRQFYHELEDSVIQQFRDDFEKYGSFDYKSSDRDAIFKNGSTVKFRAMDRDGKSVLSTEYDVVVFCQAEAIKEEIFLLAMGRLSGKTMPKSLMLTEGNPDSTWVKRRYKDNNPDELEKLGVYFREVSTDENKSNLPEGYIENLKANYPERFIRRFLEGRWENLDEMVFSEFDEYKHIVDCIDYKYIKPYKQRQGFDYGWKHPSAIVWGYVDYDGNLTIFDEWRESGKTPEEIEEACNKYTEAQGKKNVIVADYAIKRPESDGRSIWDDLIDAGLNLLESNKQEIETISLINTLFKQGRLKITKNCQKLISEMREYKYKPDSFNPLKSQREETIDRNNDLIDALRYLIASLEEMKTPNPIKAEFKKSILWQVQQTNTKMNRQGLS